MEVDTVAERRVSCSVRLPEIIRVIKPRGMRWVRKVARVVERRYAYRVLVGKRDEETLLGRPGHSWEDNINMDLQEVGSGHGLH